MSRRAKYTFPLSDGRIVGANFKIRGDYFRVQFAHPTEEGRYVEAATGVAVPKNFDPKKDKDPPADWFNESSKIIQRHYSPTLPTDLKKVTWETVIAEIEAECQLRTRSLEVYLSTLSIFRRYVPGSKGPGDVTAEVAIAFMKKYAADGFSRSKKSDAKKYPRKAKTVENMVRRMTGLFAKLMPKYVKENPWSHVKRPTVPKTVPTIPTETDVTQFFTWLENRYPGWELVRLFVEVKALIACRLQDLCFVRSNQFNATGCTLTINPSQDKTHRERVVPLPTDVCAALERTKGPTFLWERYLEESKKHRPSKLTKYRTEFTPELMYNAMKSLFRDYGKTGGKLRSHGLRKRAITLTALATQSVDQTAEAIGLDAATARKYYLDAKTAFDGNDLLKKMAEVLRPKK
ncbi:MAG: site-specific integrase [Planctomycetes bacterium]|nr:site-specific integrase [Planctomycetota bacterium]